MKSFPCTLNCEIMTFPQFTSSLWSISQIMVEHENKALQEKALKVVPVIELQIAAVKRMRNLQRALKRGYINSEPDVKDVLLLELLHWFKNSFFSWFDSPKCRFCGAQTKFHTLTNNVNARLEVNRVEVYICQQCHRNTNFVRHRQSEMLLETRTGRCGEWVQCFTLICRALGWEVRHIYDVTDHVWVEVFSESQQCWLHCDPCENVFDDPLMYEAGWNKKLSYVIACSYDDIQDVTWRYTSNFGNVLRHRNMCSEKQLLDFIFQLREQKQKGLSLQRRQYLQKRLAKELAVFLTQPKLPDKEFEGRSSGSYQWRLSRGEISEKTGYVWTPDPSEVKTQRFHLDYSCEKDSYFRGPDNVCCMSGWQKGVLEYESIFRKEEKDWKMYYLSRTDEEVVGIQCFDGSADLIVAAELSGGRGANAWQHAQIFRQPAGADSYAFSIDIKLRKP